MRTPPSKQRVLEIHESVIDRYGGGEGLRDENMLLSAISQPFASFGGEFLHSDIFEMAAAYVFHIAEKQPFLDGNKRTALASAVIFLAMNNIQIENNETGLVEITLAISDGTKDKSDIAEFFRSLVVGQ